MKVAVIDNRDRQNVIDLIGSPNREKIGPTSIQRITGPVGRDPSTPSDAVQRLSLFQRTLLLARFLKQSR